MRPFRFKVTLTEEVILPTTGLAFVGALLRTTRLRQRLSDLALGSRKRPEIAHADVVRSMLGLITIGKPDFDAIAAYQDDEFFRSALFLDQVPSPATLRQRMDQLAVEPEVSNILLEESAAMIARHAPLVSPSAVGLVPLDIDVSPFDNSKTKKEGVSMTYKKVEGYAPNFAYLGEEGYAVNVELREGSQHCQAGTPAFIRRTLELASRITKQRLLVRMDAGNDALENLDVLEAADVEYVIKRNLRKENPDDWMVEARRAGTKSSPRRGKDVYVGSVRKLIGAKERRVVFEVIERTMEPDGQLLTVPHVEVHTFWTSLADDAEEIVELYRDHGTSEQFHSELKSDLDLERLPSGKFATNDLVLKVGIVAYNVLRLCGQRAIAESAKLPDHQRPPQTTRVKRRRVRSVMQDLIYLAARFTRHARRLGLAIWTSSRWGPAWERTYLAFCDPR